MHASSFIILAACSCALAKAPPPPSIHHTATGTCQIAAAAATAKTESPTSNVPGKVFDRILTVYLETTSFGNATADLNCQALINQGLLLSNMYGVGAPSQPNYIAPASGDTFGLNSDSFILVDSNISTIVDLLEDKGISWGDYNEGLPYTGFEGFQYDPGLYMRKHNLLARFDSVRLNPHRIARMKNTTLFYKDLKNQQLPQWSFVTPNLFDDGHNTDVYTSCAWTRGFVESLLQNTYFNTNALIYVVWQANGDAPGLANHVAGILLGSALPQNLIGTADSNYYNHYSELASVEANWDLHTLGRWDVGANVWQFVGNKTGDEIRQWDPQIAHGSFESYLWNQSYGGVFSNANDTTHTYVAPNLQIQRNGRTVLPAIAAAWGGCKHGRHPPKKGKSDSASCSGLPDYYRDIIELPDAFHPPPGFQVPIPLLPPPPITTPIAAYPYSNPPPAPTTNACPV